jgi:hypothetical protein
MRPPVARSLIPYGGHDCGNLTILLIHKDFTEICLQDLAGEGNLAQ